MHEGKRRFLRKNNMSQKQPEPSSPAKSIELPVKNKPALDGAPHPPLSSSLKAKEKENPKQKPPPPSKFEWSSLLDLRPEVQKRSLQTVTKDCPDLIGHPLAVFSIVLVGLLLLIWGLFLMYKCFNSTDEDQKQHLFYLISIQMIIGNTFVCFISGFVPWRLKTSINLYSILIVLLWVQYAVFLVCFTGLPQPLTKRDVSEIEKNIEANIEAKLLAELDSRLV